MRWFEGIAIAAGLKLSATTGAKNQRTGMRKRSRISCLTLILKKSAPWDPELPFPSNPVCGGSLL